MKNNLYYCILFFCCLGCIKKTSKNIPLHTMYSNPTTTYEFGIPKKDTLELLIHTNKYPGSSFWVSESLYLCSAIRISNHAWQCFCPNDTFMIIQNNTHVYSERHGLLPSGISRWVSKDIFNGLDLYIYGSLYTQRSMNRNVKNNSCDNFEDKFYCYDAWEPYEMIYHNDTDTLTLWLFQRHLFHQSIGLIVYNTQPVPMVWDSIIIGDFDNNHSFSVYNTQLNPIGSFY